MNISGNDTEAILYPDQILLIFKVFLFLYIPIIASSIFGNVLIIIVVARDKVTTTGILFGILAGEDLLATCFGPVLALASFIPGWYEFYTAHPLAMLINEFAIDTSAALSTWTLVVITTERLLSITMPFNVKQLMTVRRVILAEIWTSIAVAVVQYLRLFHASDFEKYQGFWVIFLKKFYMGRFFLYF
ncbi:hypothetical protein DPMN_185716 [Dreissena polymorpha]|uniref:G-protein coupled receptors family 1 profile domain-containing protein n=1 Tax=Dreissena polymorpha TaxID=45954 RepID=A0A9D4I8Y7_DREPO|nr:hypothetical protein DPMN_185716 [Dreissena polymorpha]